MSKMMENLIFDIPADDSLVYYHGKPYSSIAALTNAAGVSYDTVGHYRKSGLTLEEAVDKAIMSRRGMKFIYKGKYYKSVLALAEDLNLPSKMIYNQMGKGLSLPDAVAKVKSLGKRKPGHMGPPKQKVVFEGKEYESKTSLIKHLGISAKRVSRYTSTGKTFEEAVKICVRNKAEKLGKPIVVAVEGVTYDSLKKFCSEKGYTYSAVLSRYKKFNDIDKAVDSYLKREKGQIK
jgi:hypothetical protein